MVARLGAAACAVSAISPRRRSAGPQQTPDLANIGNVLELEHARDDRFGALPRPAREGALKIIAAIEELAVIRKILTLRGLPARTPPRAPARPLALFNAA
jgi:hypothetical protein